MSRLKYKYLFAKRVDNSVDPDKMASLEVILSSSTVFLKQDIS